MPRPTLADAAFSLKAFAAATLALYLAFRLDLPRPYWAFTTAYIVARPLSGMTRSKALYRFFGTLVGATAAVVLIPAFVNAPELLNLALALWIAFCLYLSLTQPEPRGYAFRLSGYTAALVGFPCVDAPDQVFQTALARVEEISLGLACACVVGDLALPRHAGPALLSRFDAWLAAGARWTADVLRGREPSAEAQRFALQATGLAELSVHATYDTPELRPAEAATQALYVYGRMLAPVVSGLSDRLRALGAEQAALGPAAGMLAKWLAAGPRGAPAEAIPIRAAIAAARRPGLPLLHAGALARLDETTRLWRACLALRGCVRRGVSPPALRRAARDREAGCDHRAAALAAGARFVAIFACGSAFVAVGWKDAATATMMAAMMCAVFVARDDPAAAMARFSLWITAGALAAGPWLFAVAPAIDGFLLLAFSLGVVLLPAGLAVTKRATAGAALASIFGFGGVMAIQETYAADFAVWLNNVVAVVVGVWTASLIMGLIRSGGSAERDRRLLAAGRADVARIAGGRSTRAPTEVPERMLDRFVAMAPRFAASPAGARTRDDALADLRAGFDALKLRRVRDLLAPPARRAVDLALASLARDRARRPSPALRRRIDFALGRLAAAPESEAALEAAVALDGLRRALWRDAPPARAPLEEAA